MLLCKAEDWAVASATAIDDNEAEGHLDKQKLWYLMTEVIYNKKSDQIPSGIELPKMKNPFWSNQKGLV